MTIFEEYGAFKGEIMHASITSRQARMHRLMAVRSSLIEYALFWSCLA